MAIKIRFVTDFDKKGMTEAEKALDNLGKSAGIALAAVGAAMAGIAVKSVQEFAKFDAALVQSQAIMGDLTDALKNDMANAARDVAKVTTFSAEQAAESYFFLASAGLDAKSSIAALPQVAQFAQAGMFDMALATDLLTDAQSALGLTIRDDAVANMNNMIKVSDVLVRANTLANASVEQFSTSLTNKAGAALRALGKDVEEGVAVLAAFADQGIKGEEAGTQLAIVLRDLTTKAIDNKDAFAQMGIGVFDSAGEMNNLGDIVGNLETALAGMSDETQKATLLQLGFSDKSLASLQALLGTSEAIKTYEKELRSASGFTADVANAQLDSFSSQVKLLESAFIDVGLQIGEQITPLLKDLIPVLQELIPEIGERLVEAVKQIDWVQLTEDISGFFISIVENIDTIIEVTKMIGLLAVGLVTYTTGVKVANTWTAILNKTMRLNPFVLVATGLVTLTLALNDFSNSQKRAREEATGLTGDQAKLRAELKRLKELVDNGVISYKEYKKAISPIIRELSTMEGQLGATAGEFNRFNNLNLDRVRNQIRNVNQDILNMYHSGIAASAVFEGVLDFRTGKGVDFNLPKSVTQLTTVTDVTTGGGKTAAELAAEQFAKVQDIIKTASKATSSAQKSYLKSVESSVKTFGENTARLADQYSLEVLRATDARDKALRDSLMSHMRAIEEIQLQSDKKLNDIVIRSQKGLTDAYSAATRITISEILGEFNQAEDARKRLFEESRKEAEKNKQAFDDIFRPEDAVANLEARLRQQVETNRTLALQSQGLFQAGFSQRFIEQMLAAGNDGGIALAEALFAATPETRASIQSLFDEVEQQSRTGVDALAQQIYNTAGLATQELKDLYAVTEAELIISLEHQLIAYENQQAEILRTFDRSVFEAAVTRDKAILSGEQALVAGLRDAQAALRESLQGIEEEFTSAVDALDGKLAGLSRTINQVLANFVKLNSQASSATAGAEAGLRSLAPNLLTDADLFSSGTGGKATVGGSTYNVTVNAGVGSDPVSIGRYVVDAIKRYESVSGKVFSS